MILKESSPSTGNLTKRNNAPLFREDTAIREKKKIICEFIFLTMPILERVPSLGLTVLPLRVASHCRGRMHLRRFPFPGVAGLRVRSPRRSRGRSRGGSGRWAWRLRSEVNNSLK